MKCKEEPCHHLKGRGALISRRETRMMADYQIQLPEGLLLSAENEKGLYFNFTAKTTHSCHQFAELLYKKAQERKEKREATDDKLPGNARARNTSTGILFAQEADCDVPDPVPSERGEFETQLFCEPTKHIRVRPSTSCDSNVCA